MSPNCLKNYLQLLAELDHHPLALKAQRSEAPVTLSNTLPAWRPLWKTSFATIMSRL